jgi:hypothetical protein
LHAVPDLPKKVQERLYFVRFEDLMENPSACPSHIFTWRGLPACAVDLEQLTVGIQESDSHYHMKYLHRQANRLVRPTRHEIAARIQAQIETALCETTGDYDSALQFAPHAMANADPANRPINYRICTPSYRRLKLASPRVGVIRGGKKKPTGLIDAALWQSLIRDNV